MRPRDAWPRRKATALRRHTTTTYRAVYEVMDRKLSRYGSAGYVGTVFYTCVYVPRVEGEASSTPRGDVALIGRDAPGLELEPTRGGCDRRHTTRRGRHTQDTPGLQTLPKNERWRACRCWGYGAKSGRMGEDVSNVLMWYAPRVSLKPCRVKIYKRADSTEITAACPIPNGTRLRDEALLDKRTRLT